MKRSNCKRIFFLALSLTLMLGSALSVQAKSNKEEEAAIDYSQLNLDLNEDGTPDLNIDTDGDGVADINIDQDGDGYADLNRDVDSDLLPDLNTDIDGDGSPDLNIDTNGDGYPDTNVDSNFDGKADIWFTEGPKSHFRPDDVDGLVFAADGNFEEFQGVKVDGQLLTDDDFTALEGDSSGINEGDTIVQIFYSYLKTLPADLHTVTFVYADEELSCYFYVDEDNLLTAATSDASKFMLIVVGLSALFMVAVLLIIWKIVTKPVNKEF